MKKLGIIATVLALMMFLVTSVIAVDPVIIPSVPDQTKDEDTAAWTLDLTGYETDTEDIGIDLDWSVSDVDTTLFTAVITDLDEDILTFTPVANANGADTITLTLTDSNSDTVTQDITVTLNPVNDAPVLDISACALNAVEDDTYTCTLTATDEDDTTFLFTDVTLPDGMTLDTSTGAISWTPDDEQIRGHTIEIKVEDDETPTPASDTKSFTLFVRTDDICEDYTSGSDLKITDWTITDDDEDFHPKDDIEIEVEVENEGDDEVEDVTIEVTLYDTTDGKRLDVVKSSRFDLDEDESESVDMILEIPENMDTDNDFIVFVIVYEDGNADDQCDWEYEDNLDFKRRKHDVSIEKVSVSPSTVKAGKTVEVKVDVENVGDRNEEDVYIMVKNSVLGIEKKSEPFDVDSYEKGDDDEYSTTIVFTVPEDANADTYDLEVYVYDEDDDIFSSGEKFVEFTVSGTSTSSTTGTGTTSTTATGTVTTSTEGAPTEVEQGKSFSIPVKLTNTADETKSYKLTVSNIADWAETTSEIEAYLIAGQSSIYYITVTPKTDAAEGKHSATINVKEGSTVVSTKTLSFTIPETGASAITGATTGVDGTSGTETDGEEGFVKKVFSGTTLWIIGDLLLIVIAIFFIKMLFSKRS